MQETRSDQTDQITAPCHQATGERIRLVVQLFDPLHDPLASLLADVGMFSQDFRYRGLRNAQILCYVFHSNGHTEAIPAKCLRKLNSLCTPSDGKSTSLMPLQLPETATERRNNFNLKRS